MSEVQEEMAELAVKWMLKVPKLSAELIVAGLKAIVNAIINKEPLGLQKIEKLTRGTGQKMETVNLSDLAKDMTEFKKLARKYGVGFSAFKSGEGYTLFFRAERAEQMSACIAAYTKRKLDKPQKEGIQEKLDRATQQREKERIDPSLSEAREHHKTRTRERGRI